MEFNIKTAKRVKLVVEEKPDQFEQDAMRRQVWLDDSNVVDTSDDIIVNQNPNDDDNELLALTNLEHKPDYTDTYVAVVGNGHIDPYLEEIGWTIKRSATTKIRNQMFGLGHYAKYKK